MKKPELIPIIVILSIALGYIAGKDILNIKYYFFIIGFFIGWIATSWKWKDGA